MTNALPGRENVERQINRLSNERTELFAKGSGRAQLTPVDKRRLREIEQELDECFRARRVQQAARDAQRFEQDRFRVRRDDAVRPNP